MKVILSRKGFDSAAGGIPSPILGDQLISLPIPKAYSGDDYRELKFHYQKQEFSYAQLLKDLNVTFFNECHLDPDLIRGVKKRDGVWCPALGQAGNAAAELREVQPGDFFIFFGNFRQAERINGKFQFVKGSKEMHVIWGYLKVQEIYSKAQIQKGAVTENVKYHPHFRDADFTEQSHNFIFASDIDNSRVFPFSEQLILSDISQKSYKKSFWKAIPFLEPQSKRIKKVKSGLWNSGGRGQEFVCEIKNSQKFDQWFSNLIQG